MCNLSQGVEEKGIAKGLARGRAEGRAEATVTLIRNLMDNLPSLLQVKVMIFETGATPFLKVPLATAEAPEQYALAETKGQNDT